MKLSTGAEMRVTGPDDGMRGRVRERRSVAGGGRNLERDQRVARAETRPTSARARLRRGALSREVVASPRVVRRRRTRGRTGGGRTAGHPPRLLDGRSSLHRDRRRAGGHGGHRSRTVDPGSARRDDPSGQAVHRHPRRARPLVPRSARRLGVTLAKGLRSSAGARRGRPLRPHSRRAPRCRIAAVGKAPGAAESRPLGESWSRRSSGGSSALRKQTTPSALVSRQRLDTHFRRREP